MTTPERAFAPGLTVNMAHEILQHTGIDSFFEHFDCKRMAQSMAGNSFVDTARLAARLTAFCRPDSIT